MNQSTDWLSTVLGVDNGKAHPRCRWQKVGSLEGIKGRDFHFAAAAATSASLPPACLPWTVSPLCCPSARPCHCLGTSQLQTKTSTNCELK